MPMKRLGCILLTLLVLLLGTVIPVSAQEPALVLEAPTVSGEAGETVTVAVRLSQNPGVTSLKLSLSYDTNVLKLTKAQNQPLLEGWYQASPTLDTFPYLAVWVSSEVQSKTGELILLEFQIAQGLSFGTVTSPTLTVEEVYCNGATVPAEPLSFSVEVACHHTYGAYTRADDLNHTRECSKCHEVEVLPHTWDNGKVTTPATETQEGKKTFTCSACGTTRIEEIPKLDAPGPSATGDTDNPNNPGGSGNNGNPNNPGGSGNNGNPNNPGGSGNSGKPTGPSGMGLIFVIIGVAVIAVIAVVILILKKRSAQAPEPPTASPSVVKVTPITPTNIVSKPAPKVTPKEAPKVTPKEAPKVTSKEAPKVTPKEAPKVTPKAPPAVAPKPIEAPVEKPVDDPIINEPREEIKPEPEAISEVIPTDPEKLPVEELPTEAPLTEEAPVTEETPIEEAPVTEEIPIEETPAEEEREELPTEPVSSPDAENPEAAVKDEAPSLEETAPSGAPDNVPTTCKQEEDKP